MRTECRQGKRFSADLTNINAKTLKMGGGGFKIAHILDGELIKPGIGIACHVRTQPCRGLRDRVRKLGVLDGLLRHN